MITNFRGINISSKNPKQLVLFYKDLLGLKIVDDDANYDGVAFGNGENEPVFWVWDENKWGKSTTGTVTLVFDCDDPQKTYEELKRKGVALDPPSVADWGGTELIIKDPDGNTVLIL